MSAIEKAIKENYTDFPEVSGIDFLRDAINYLDSRNEVENVHKTPIQLLTEYANYLNE